MMKFFLISVFFCATAFAADLMNIPVNDIQGNPTSLAAYNGKVLLVVNTASKCGYTPQYKGLQELYEKYRSKGFEVLAFPSNDYGGQEPGTSDEIKNFCERKYATTFPLFEKLVTTGKGIHPLFRALIESAPDKREIKWNFEKFLIDKRGKVVARFGSTIKPREISPDIERLL